MKATVLVGGSGKWNLIVERKTVAGGHIPSAAPFDKVLASQLRQLAAMPPGCDYWKKLGGGSLREVDVDDSVIEALIWRYETAKSR
jgi:hypothetical protein